MNWQIYTQHSFPNLTAMAQKRGTPVTVFDLEATTKSAYFGNFAILEVGMVSVHPDGTVWSIEGLVNPEQPIPRVVTELTGIRPSDVNNREPWPVQWAPLTHDVCTNHVTAGYNSRTYDCPGIVRSNAKAGLETTVREHLDVKRLLGLRCSLESALAELGEPPPLPRHRARPDALATARLLELSLKSDDLVRLLAEPAPQGVSLGSKQLRQFELVERAERGQTLSPQELAAEFGLAPSTLEDDLLYLLRSKQLDVSQLLPAERLASLRRPVDQARAACGLAPTDLGPLKPLKAWLAEHGVELDWFELRVAVRA